MIDIKLQFHARITHCRGVIRPDISAYYRLVFLVRPLGSLAEQQNLFTLELQAALSCDATPCREI